VIVPLEIPPGAVRSGTEYQAKGRWRDVNLVRWRHGAGPLPVGGWNGVTPGFDPLSIGKIRGAMAWVDNSDNPYVVGGSYNGAWVWEPDGTFTDITPTLTSGNESASSIAPASTWSWGAFGEVPIGCLDADGKVWEWDLNTANNLTQVTNSPTSCTGVVVTAERFIFALGDGGDPRSIRWCDRDDRTTWSPATTNQAGGWDLKTEGEIQFGIQMRGEVLIVTSTDAWSARYVGYPDVYAFSRIGVGGAAGKLVGARVDDRAYWLGESAFYEYSGGFVRELPCDVWDYFFADIASGQVSKTSAWHNSEQGEVWWLYDSTQDSGDVSRYVAYNYREGWWSYGQCPATTIVDTVELTTPLRRSPVGFHPLGSTLVTNGTFAADTDWTKGTNWRIAGGVADQSAPTASNLEQSISSLTSGKRYLIGFTTSNRTAGALSVVFGGAAIASVNSNTTTWAIGTADGTSSTLSFQADGTWDGDLDNVVMYNVPLQEHETGYVYDGYTPYAETGPLDLGTGEQRVHVMQVIPDEQDAGELTLTFKTKEYPGGSETTHGPYQASAPTDVRFSGRQFKMKVEHDTAQSTRADWRSGVHRLDVHLGGRR
jgi:hypothetical protein